MCHNIKLRNKYIMFFHTVASIMILYIYRKTVEYDKFIKKTFSLKVNHTAHTLAASHTSTYPWNQEARMNKPNRLGKLCPPVIVLAVICVFSSNPHWSAFISTVSVNRSECELFYCILLSVLSWEIRDLTYFLSSFSQVTCKVLL